MTTNLAPRILLAEDEDAMRTYLERALIKAGYEVTSVDRGTEAPLETSIPPQSPVAWSNFITGMHPGGHGVYDFLHLDPEHMAVASSTQTSPPASNIGVGAYTDPSGATVPAPG